MITGLNEQERKEICRILTDYSQDYFFYFYGSRVKGNFAKFSDLDVYVVAINGGDYGILDELQDIFDDNMKILFKVNFTRDDYINDDFRKIIKSYAIPYDWENFMLGDVIRKNTDRIKISELTLDNYITTDNMIPNFSGIKKATSLPDVKTLPFFQESYILFSNIRTYFKKVYYVKDFKGGCSNDVLVFIANEKIYPYFLYYILTTSDFIEYTVATSKGAKMPRGDKLAIQKYELKLPPLEEQKSIADVLNSFDHYIENLQQQNIKLEELAKNIFKQTFTHNPQNKTWEEKTLGDIISVKKGQAITKSKTIKGNIPVVAGGLDYAYFHNLHNTHKNSITISASGANAGYVWFHYYPIWASDCTVIKDENDYKTIFIYLFLKINQTRITHLQTGAAQPHVYPKQIAELKIIYPTNLKELMTKITPLFNKISKNNQIIQKLKNQRNYLLPHLINGKVRILQS